MPATARLPFLARPLVVERALIHAGTLLSDAARCGYRPWACLPRLSVLAEGTGFEPVRPCRNDGLANRCIDRSANLPLIFTTTSFLSKWRVMRDVEKLVWVAGFEPAASRFQGGPSSRTDNTPR
jgi:hypothetical protein